MVETARGTALHARVVETIAADQQDLVQLCLELGNMHSPHAQERPIAEKVAAWLAAQGIESWLQPLTDTSANVVGRIRGAGAGAGDGTSLMFNAHLDVGPPLKP